MSMWGSRRSPIISASSKRPGWCARREERRGRWSFYSLDREAAGRLLAEAGGHLGVAPRWEAGLRVLFLCTHNSARSQMAEGLLRHLAGDRFEVMSAGTEAASVRPETIAVMAELSVDISGQDSKTLDRYLDEPFDYVITVCDAANEACPVFPGAKKRLHWSFRDPSRATGDEERRLEVFREVRDEILARIEKDLVPVGREPLTSS
jgi:arsenate reductase